MMIRILVLTVVVTASGMWMPAEAEAGPLLDWLRGLRQRRNCNPCQPWYSTTARYQPNPMNLQPGQCARTCMQTCSRTVVNYVAETAYRTAWNRVPVTQYRPVTNTDPSTGCTVTCMRPCTTYTWQMRRIPYTTYRPVYRTQTYRVPVTTITNGCNPCGTGLCSTGACNTCTVPTTATPTHANNGVYYTNPNDGSVINNETLSPEGTFNTPADIPPNLENANPQSYQRPSVLDQIQDTTTGHPGSGINRQVNGPTQSTIAPTGNQNGWENSRPTFSEDKTARSPIRERWSYSPVRYASFQQTESQPKMARQAGQQEVIGALRPVRPVAPAPQPKTKVNSGWTTVSW